MVASQVTLHISMVKMQTRLPERFGWPGGPLPSSILGHEIVPKESFAEIVPRQGDTATFLSDGGLFFEGYIDFSGLYDDIRYYKVYMDGIICIIFLPET